MSPVITLTTDFGLSDAYVASMKGVILSINPEATVVDVSHVIEPQNIVQAAFVLHAAHHYFPNDTIHIVVVDPGVGSRRKAIIVRTPSAYFLAPDNGVLSYIVDELYPLPGAFSYQKQHIHRVKKMKGNLKIVAITNSSFWHQPVSTTFHGRDIFAPVAAHLSLGIPIQGFGEEIDSLYTFPPPKPYFDSNGNLVGQILHIDYFGNLVTNIRASDTPHENIVMTIGKQLIPGVARCYSEMEGLAVVSGSCGYLEVSLSNGNAAAFLGAKVGDRIKLAVKKRR